MSAEPEQPTLIPTVKRRRPRARQSVYGPPQPVVVLFVTWLSGKEQKFEGQRLIEDRECVGLYTVTPSFQEETVLIRRDQCRTIVISRPWQPPAQVQAPALTAPAAARPAESVMHVSPGMAARKVGRTVVSPDGQTGTLTPDGDIIGAALFAAGMPPGRPGL